MQLNALGAGMLCVLASRLAIAQGAPHPLTTLPTGDAAYVQLAALERGGCGVARISPHRPFMVRDVRRAITQFASNAQCRGPIAEALEARFSVARPPELPRDVAPDLAAAARETMTDTLDTFRVGALATVRLTSLSKGEFEPLWAGVRPKGEGTPPVVADARARASWSASPKIVAVSELYAQTSRRNDPTVRQRALRNTSGLVDFGETYVNASLGRLDVSFGRNWAAWLGDGTESLALSANGPLLDRLELGVRWRVAEARAIVASVNDVTMTAPLDSLAASTPATRFHRWLYGHVLTIKPTAGLELTLGETLLSARTTRGFDLAYANPVIAYIVAQNDTGRVGSDTRDNLIVFGGARAALGTGHVGAELVVDDVQIDKADRERTADQLAWRLYGVFGLPLGVGASATAEYRRVDSYAYMRDFYTDVYQQYDKPLGSVLGPGSDLLRLSGETWLRGDMRLSGGIGRWRQGALRIDQRPAQGPNDNADRPFPATTETRPAVQTALLADLRAERLAMRVPVSVQVQLARIENAANVPAAAALYVRALVTGSYAFRYP
ncbi:MAG TPA: capsule assembly Wzi family protein [Gemmatimonadaceae bacterium]|nr:capsule assembly Wzi family protein [Gemmatimonadaceae bacterium]